MSSLLCGLDGGRRKYKSKDIDKYSQCSDPDLRTHPSYLQPEGLTVLCLSFSFVGEKNIEQHARYPGGKNAFLARILQESYKIVQDNVFSLISLKNSTRSLLKMGYLQDSCKELISLQDLALKVFSLKILQVIYFPANCFYLMFLK